MNYFPCFLFGICEWSERLKVVCSSMKILYFSILQYSNSYWSFNDHSLHKLFMTVPKGSAVLPLGWQVNKPLLFDDRSSVLKLMMILVARAPTYFCTLMRFNKIFHGVWLNSGENYWSTCTIMKKCTINLCLLFSQKMSIRKLAVVISFLQIELIWMNALNYWSKSKLHLELEQIKLMPWNIPIQ